MTNAEKFIEVMNEYFDAGLTKENLRDRGYVSGFCTPCGVFRAGACESFKCDKCTNWWEKDWKSKGEITKSEKILPIPCTKVEEKTVKDWLQKINEELDELKEMIIICFPCLGAGMEDCYALDDADSEDKEIIAEEAADTITAITSMLEAMGIDEEMRQAVQKSVNEKNKDHGRF